MLGCMFGGTSAKEKSKLGLSAASKLTSLGHPGQKSMSPSSEPAFSQGQSLLSKLQPGDRYDVVLVLPVVGSITQSSHISSSMGPVFWLHASFVYILNSLRAP